MIFAFTASYLYWLLLPLAVFAVCRVATVADQEAEDGRELNEFAALTFAAYVLLVAF